LETFRVSCVTGEGLDDWVNWLKENIQSHALSLAQGQG
jgi:hypothetical protein